MASILIVDDRAISREYLVTLLGYAGHQIIEAGDASTALEIIRAHKPDLVIADILMPEVDGFELARRVRADPEIAATRVIFYTATYLESETRALAQACGVDHVIVKPAEPEVILEVVQQVLELKAPSLPPVVPGEFDHNHQRLLLDKLTQKIDELETVNADLERRVQERTAALKAANERLEGLNRLRNELLAIASHDLRSPLGSIKAMADLMLEEGENLPEVPYRRFLTHIRTSAQHLTMLVSNLLDLEKLETGVFELEYESVRVSEIASSTITTLTPGAAAKSIAVQLVVSPDEPVISADRLRLAQIFSNLVGNAIKFTPQGGRVAVSIEPEEGGVRVSVSDSGLGIAPDDLPHLFEKFRRLHAHGTAGEPGSGLGLAIVKQLIDMHGGSIAVTSEVGRGSSFTFSLPATQRADGTHPDR